MDIWVWAIALVFFSVLEAITVTPVCAWFVGGSVAGLISAICGAGVLPQCMWFVIVSGVMLLSLQPFFKKFAKTGRLRTNVDALNEQQAVVTQAIDNLHAAGVIRINGAEWSARSEDGRNIPVDSIVRITRVEGVKAFVEPVSIPSKKN